MNQNLIEIDEDSLDTVAGGGLFGAIGGAVDSTLSGVVCVAGEVVEAGAHVAGGVLSTAGGILSGLGGFLQGKKRW